MVGLILFFSRIDPETSAAVEISGSLHQGSVLDPVSFDTKPVHFDPDLVIFDPDLAYFDPDLVYFDPD